MLKYDLAILILVIALGILYNLPEEKIVKSVGADHPTILDILHKESMQHKF
jgi:hypothetical protein